MKAMVSTRLTAQASLMLQRRGIALEWDEDTLRLPSIEMDDARDSTLKLAFKQIPQAGDKWLRVVYRGELNMKTTYDHEANALYVQFSNKAVERTEELRPGINLDFDRPGHIIGIEMLDAKKQLSEAALKSLEAA